MILTNSETFLAVGNKELLKELLKDNELIRKYEYQK